MKLEKISAKNALFSCFFLSDTNAVRHRIENFPEECKNYFLHSRIFSDKFPVSCTAVDLAGGDEDYISCIGELKLRDAILEEMKAINEIEYISY